MTAPIILTANDIRIGTRYVGSNGHSTVTAVRSLPAGRLDLTLRNTDTGIEWSTVWSADDNPVFLAGFHNDVAVDELVAQILAALPPIKHDPTPDRGFMLQGAETAYADIGRLVEDAAWTLLGNVGMLEKVVIEEYTIRSRRSHLPHADDLCVYLEECAADNEACENVEYGRSPAVLALAEALAQRMSNEGNGWMCDEQTATHIVTLAGRQPILDGEPWGEPLPEPDGSACHEAFPCDDCVRERLQ